MDPERGLYSLLFDLGCGQFSRTVRFQTSESPTAIRYSFLSREFFMQLNNVVLVSSMVIILWGNTHWLRSNQWQLYSIGKPFFDFFFVPLMLFLAIAIDLCCFTLEKDQF